MPTPALVAVLLAGWLAISLVLYLHVAPSVRRHQNTPKTRSLYQDV